MKQRELKFRAWDKVAKAMSPAFALFGEFTLMGAVHDWQMESRGHGDAWENGTEPSLLEMLNDLEIMQFTGLLDKEGREIYEGDLVECAPSGTVGVVRWYDELCMFTLQVKLDVEDLEEYTMTAYSEQVDGRNTKRIVIGNVFTTPELIKTT